MTGDVAGWTGTGSADGLEWMNCLSTDHLDLCSLVTVIGEASGELVPVLAVVAKGSYPHTLEST